jgi:hypothetical protein
VSGPMSVRPFRSALRMSLDDTWFGTEFWKIGKVV